MNYSKYRWPTDYSINWWNWWSVKDLSPNDKKRFWTQEKLQDWYNDGIDIGRQRHFYYMENAEGKLAAIVWLRKSDLPAMMSDAKEKLSQTLSTEKSENIDFHTEAFRVYPPFRGGRWLGSIILRESTEEYKKAGNKWIVIWDVDEGNIASQKTHVNAQYMLLWHGEAAKTGSHWEKRLLYAKVI